MTKSFINYKDMLIRAYSYIYIHKQFVNDDEIIYDEFEKCILINEDDKITCKFKLNITNTITNKSRLIAGVIKLTEGDLKFMLESLVNNYIY